MILSCQESISPGAAVWTEGQKNHIKEEEEEEENHIKEEEEGQVLKYWLVQLLVLILSNTREEKEEGKAGAA